MSGQKTTENNGAEPQGFQALFYGHLDSLEQRAHAVGLTLTDMCRDADVARATPDRWRKKLPKTIQNVCDLEAVVVKAEREDAKDAARLEARDPDQPPEPDTRAALLAARARN